MTIQRENPFSEYVVVAGFEQFRVGDKVRWKAGKASGKYPEGPFTVQRIRYHDKPETIKLANHNQELLLTELVGASTNSRRIGDCAVSYVSDGWFTGAFFTKDTP